MITVEIRINGSLISALSAVNVGVNPDGTHRYKFQYAAFPLSHDDAIRASKGTLDHKRTDGAEALVKKILTVVAQEQ